MCSHSLSVRLAAHEAEIKFDYSIKQVLGAFTPAMPLRIIFAYLRPVSKYKNKLYERK
jgi:hypothetical protein